MDPIAQSSTDSPFMSQRASLAASLLQKQGFSSLFSIRGGIQAWKQAGLPLNLGVQRSQSDP